MKTETTNTLCPICGGKMDVKAEIKKHILEFLEFTKHYTRDVDNKVWHSGYYYSEVDLNTNVMASSDEIAFTDDEMIDRFLKRKMVESKLIENNEEK